MKWVLFATMAMVAVNFGWWMRDWNAGAVLFGVVILVDWWVSALKRRGE